jgi:hypothetical protein
MLKAAAVGGRPWHLPGHTIDSFSTDKTYRLSGGFQMFGSYNVPSTAMLGIMQSKIQQSRRNGF